MDTIYYGAWVSRAGDGTFLAELPDFPEVTVQGPSLTRVVALASVRLSAQVAVMRREGRALPQPTSVSELLDGCLARRAVGHLLEVSEPVNVATPTAAITDASAPTPVG